MKEGFDLEKSKEIIGESRMKYLSISQQQKKRTWGTDMVRGAVKCTAATLGGEVGARPVWVVKDPQMAEAGRGDWRVRGLHAQPQSSRTEELLPQLQGVLFAGCLQPEEFMSGLDWCRGHLVQGYTILSDLHPMTPRGRREKA